MNNDDNENGDASFAEERRRWLFRQSSLGAWYWRQAKERAQSELSLQGFPTLADCIRDAQMHGYLVPTGGRRATDQLA